MITDLQSLVNVFIDLITIAIPLVVGLALLAFFKGLVSFIAKAGDTKNHAEGKNLMVWGLIALFVMISVFGIIQFFYRDIGFSGAFGVPLLPTN